MTEEVKVVLVHPDKQHSFKTATALLNMDVLDRYITTVYDKPGSLTRLCAKLVKGNFKKKLQAHRSSEIPDEKIVQFSEFLSLLLFVLVRLDKRGNLYSKLKIYRDTVFNKKVARYCKKNNIDAVVSFDVLSAQLYECLNGLGIKKIIDMSAPYFPEMYSIFERETEKYAASSLQKTLQSPMVKYWKKQNAYEASKADAFLVASEFTKQTLVVNGVEESKIFKCVYGLDHTLFNAQDRTAKPFEPLNCIYVGNVTEQKGYRYLVEAIEQIELVSAKMVNFIVAGAYNAQDDLIAKMKEKVTFTGYLMQNDLKKILLDSHVIVFPSLADGFGLSVLEAMACGVVPICSKNAGVSDLIEDGKNGFTVNAADSKAIYEKLIFLEQNRELLSEMSRNAVVSAQRMVWENYYNDVKRAINTVFRM